MLKKNAAPSNIRLLWEAIVEEDKQEKADSLKGNKKNPKLL